MCQSSLYFMLIDYELNVLFMIYSFCVDCPTYYREVIAHGVSAIAILSLAVVLKLNPHKVGTRYSGNLTMTMTSIL